jgi:hypothetical protein
MFCPGRGDGRCAGASTLWGPNPTDLTSILPQLNVVGVHKGFDLPDGVLVIFTGDELSRCHDDVVLVDFINAVFGYDALLVAGGSAWNSQPPTPDC